MISVVISTLNEKENIKKILVMLQEIKIISEIIFVDDQSNDGTFIEIKKFLKYNIKDYLRKAKKKIF
ncbi:glycosyltransferase [Candidatus Pelagibacter sp.]|nr:glycosyltransferase [Candidatus Pelagibacter sp.]